MKFIEGYTKSEQKKVVSVSVAYLVITWLTGSWGSRLLSSYQYPTIASPRKVQNSAFEVEFLLNDCCFQTYKVEKSFKINLFIVGCAGSSLLRAAFFYLWWVGKHIWCLIRRVHVNKSTCYLLFFRSEKTLQRVVATIKTF